MSESTVIGPAQTVHGNLTITFGPMPAIREDVRSALRSYVLTLLSTLAEAPVSQTEQVHQVKRIIEEAAAEASQSKPDSHRLESYGENLKVATQPLRLAAPVADLIAKTLLLVGAYDENSPVLRQAIQPNQMPVSLGVNLAQDAIAAKVVFKDALPKWHQYFSSISGNYAEQGAAWADQLAYADALLNVLNDQPATLPDGNPYQEYLEWVIDAIDQQKDSKR